MSGNSPLTQELARAEAHLSELEQQTADARNRVRELRAALDAPASSVHVGSVGGASPRSESTDPKAPTTAFEKIRLFRSLFRGREDVFPVRFVNQRTGKPGYAPACSNKFREGLCALRPPTRGKCGDCTNHAFLQVNDDAIRDHLQGRHVMGVYPLLPDETCWLLAADFDAASWQSDLRAFAETCRSNGFPLLLERSRSGQGGHAWLFFRSPIPARLARELGAALLTETMRRSSGLTLDSYDRLLPNQDTMPRGGFGNLIALPLQRDARDRGNTVFLDEELVPYADPWPLLAAVRRIEPTHIEVFLRDARRAGRIVAGRSAVEFDQGLSILKTQSRRRSAGSRRFPRIPPVPLTRSGFYSRESSASDRAALPSATFCPLRRQRLEGGLVSRWAAPAARPVGSLRY